MSDLENEPLRNSMPRRLRRNRAAQVLVYMGGLGTIACILGILVFLLIEAVPLFGSASVGKPSVVDRRHPLLCMAADSFQLRMLGVDTHGQLWDYSLAEVPPAGKDRSTKLARLAGLGLEERVQHARTNGNSFLLQTDSGRLCVQPFGFTKHYKGSKLEIEIELGKVQWWGAPDDKERITTYAATEMGESGFTIAYQRGAGPIHVTRMIIEENEMSGEVDVDKTEFDIKAGLALSSIHLDGPAANLLAVDDRARIHWWSLGDEEAHKRQLLDTGIADVTASGFLQADRSLILAYGSTGGMTQFFRVRDPEGEESFRRIRDFPAMGSSITQIVRSTRNKAFLVSSEDDEVGLYYATTGKQDWKGRPELGRIRSIALAPKGNGILVSGDGGTALLGLDNPHPEVSLNTLLGKVWYENYPEPTYTWQSTGGTDDFETKLSLVPLIFGTLKGTFFSMLLAIPLALLAALYASMFLHPSLKKVIKPAIEIMAAIPSVILGFLCAIYIAPLLESGLGGFLLLPVTLPLFMVLGSIAITRIPASVLARLPKGSELAILGGFIVLCLLFSFPLGALIEGTWFDGDAPKWITQVLGLPYEQRNAIVIAMGMSFAVIPIIFSISEDAISNVPRNLVSGSLALGANRWETAIRVILPTASPGIFSAIMIGLGRAVGETMIVLMAAGNTPIMDWNPFNGFRTLSANIAVEIPEAPHEGTLYRTLFLAAILLFIMTFFLNTIAEVVRQRLRSRYANI